MEKINQVNGNTPEDTTESMPFEVTIKTNDAMYLEYGAEPEMVEKAEGYFLSVSSPDGTVRNHSQGMIDFLGIVKALMKMCGRQAVLMAAFEASNRLNGDSDE